MLDVFDIFFVQQLVNGLAVGLIYALVAIGFTLIFGVLNVVNFAHGEIYMLGAYAGLLVITALAPPFMAVLLAVAAVGASHGLHPGAAGLPAVPPLPRRGLAEIPRAARERPCPRASPCR